VHVVYDPEADQPVYSAVSTANVNDITTAKAMPIEAGATYVFDLGYYDYAWWAKLDALGCRPHCPGPADRRLPPTALGDRAVLPLGQADLENYPLCRNLRERNSHSDRCRSNQLSAAAFGTGHPKDGDQPTRLCPPRPCQSGCTDATSAPCSTHTRLSRSITISWPFYEQEPYRTAVLSRRENRVNTKFASQAGL
jgi:hypothetical protein